MGMELADGKGNFVVINGGNPLPNAEEAGMPASWEDAEMWEDQVNENRDRFREPVWMWDCGYKLDFDGPILSISSRFYPPARVYGPGWDGKVHLRIGDYEEERLFEADTLEELRADVEECVGNIQDRILGFIQGVSDEG